MAQMEKYNMNGAMAMIRHCERTAATHSNRNIDMMRTKDNFALWPPDNPDKLVMDSVVVGQSSGRYAQQRLRKRLAELSILDRDDVKVLCCWCLFLGPDVPPGYENKMAFYKAAVRFMSGLYGSENVIFAWVHEDEASSHLHFGFVPVVKKELKLRANASEATRKAYEQAVSEGKTEYERVDAHGVITRRHLQDWHGWLSNWMKQELGYDPGVYTGVTQFLGGNVSVKQLKNTGPNWRVERNRKVDAFHNARRAAAEGEVSALDDRIVLADPATKDLQSPEKMLSFDEKIADAIGRSGPKR